MEPAHVVNSEYREAVTPELILVDKADGRIREKSKTAYLVCKRVFDVVMSLFALIVLSPVFLITAIAIYMEDRGSVFYSQERVGKNEKKFLIYKFRSMRIDADQIHEELRKEYGNQEVSFKLKDDPRVTRVGKVIRKINIDELPQLLNIVKGEMSIVGPRPLPVYEYEDEREKYGLKFAKRYSVPQGLTCIWQISDRGEVEFEDRMQMDVTYTETNNVRTDILLIFETIRAIMKGRAGY